MKPPLGEQTPAIQSRCGIPQRDERALPSGLPERSEPMEAAPTVAEILHDRDAFLAVCEELAECLLSSARLHEQAAMDGAKGFDLWRALPLMCAFPSPDHMRLMAVRLRGVVQKLEAMPASREELACSVYGSEEAFAAFRRALFADVEGEELPGLRNSAGQVSEQKGGVS